MKKYLIIAAGSFLMLFAQAGESLAGTLSTFPATSTVGNFGYRNTATYGQTFTATSALGTQLNDFTLEFELPAGLAFRAEVYAWNGTTNKATGTSLYESAPVNTGGTAPQQITFYTPGIAVTPGQQYIVFVTISKDYATDSAFNDLFTGTLSVGSSYSGGAFVDLNNGDDTTQWTATAWSTDHSNLDLAFTADFSTPTATPEPASMTLLGIGTLGMAGYAWRKRRLQQAA